MRERGQGRREGVRRSWRKRENALHVFIAEDSLTRSLRGKRGNGCAALCAVSNWMWQYIMRFSGIHQVAPRSTCLCGRVTGAASLVMMPERQL